jgi:hypothetical protein
MDFETHPVGTGKMLEWVNKEMFRRVKVENELWQCAFGKRPPPTSDECKEWALILGVPEEFRVAQQHVWTLGDSACQVSKNDA